ncbi:hypothetical protein [Rhodococcus rhodochrous]|uniref:hypothetical protein n=1 Tax=Rhodococcus rhodochrous TaxID=1829 RepID=UPI00119D597A|nr:hypothetical protein [Rhodococcus rhodochrous]
MKDIFPNGKAAFVLFGIGVVVGIAITKYWLAIVLLLLILATLATLIGMFSDLIPRCSDSPQQDDPFRALYRYVRARWDDIRQSLRLPALGADAQPSAHVQADSARTHRDVPSTELSETRESTASSKSFVTIPKGTAQPRPIARSKPYQWQTSAGSGNPGPVAVRRHNTSRSTSLRTLPPSPHEWRYQMMLFQANPPRVSLEKQAQGTVDQWSQSHSTPHEKPIHLRAVIPRRALPPSPEQWRRRRS